MTCGEARTSGAEELFAQRAIGIVALVDAALLQDRHHEIDEVLQAFRRDHPAQIEAVDVGVLDPALQLVGDLLGRAHERRVAAAEALLAEDLAQGPGLAAVDGEGPQHRVRGIVLLVAQRFVRIIAGEVDAR